MGIASNGVIIRQDISKFKAENIIADFFGPSFIELKENELWEQDRNKRFDTRKDDCIAIYKTPQFIIIENTKFTFGFYNWEDQTSIKKVYNYFYKPTQIFVFEEYGSGGTYSYCIVTNGQIERYYRSLIDKKPSVYGEPINVELKYLNAPIIKEKDTDGETLDIFIDPNTQQRCHISSMPQLLLQEVMGHEVDIYPESIYEKSVEKRYFRMT